MNTREAWTIGEIAAAYSLSTRTIRRLVANGKLAAVRIGSAVRITEESRAAWAGTLPRTVSSRETVYTPKAPE